MYFTKYNGLGNDFIFVDGADALQIQNPFALAQQLCDRRLGIGADGLVLLLPSDKADVRMRIINADGSEAEMCGNASRCVPLHLRRHTKIQKNAFTLETLAGLIRTEIIDELRGLIRVDMGEPRLLRQQIPVEGPAGQTALNVPLEACGQTFHVTAVSMGNPHAVIFVPDIHRVALATWGPALEIHPFFPRKTNVEFVQVLAPDAVRMRVWERGAGITRACGTGACATAVAAVLNGKTDERVRVQLDGGELQIDWSGRQHVWMTGPAQYVFSGEIDL